MPRPRRWSEALARCRGRLGGDRGSASIEFLTVGMLLTLPLVYLVLAVAQVQAASLAVEGAARQAARVIAAAETAEAGAAAADASIVVALDDQGLEASAVDVVCSPQPGACQTPGGTVQVTVEVLVPMPLVPDVLGLEDRLSVRIDATALQPVSELA